MIAQTLPTVAVIGAGIAGLTAALDLRQAGFEVIVFEKSRGPGGRAATRRDAEFSFDHGAQYFTCRTPEFADQLANWTVAGTVDAWSARIVAIDAGGVRRPLTSDLARYVGVPGMNAMARQLASQTDCRYRQRVTGLDWSDGWRLRLESGHTHSAGALIVTAPPAQSASLLEPIAPELAAIVQAVEMEPCWALMLAFDAPADPGFEAAFVNDGPLAWVAANRGKPGRGEAQCWVAHATGGWSAANLEITPTEVVAALLPEFSNLTGIRTPPTRISPHRWRYAKAVEPLTCGVLSDARRQLVVAGDWCAGSRLEGAWRSGRAAAKALQSADAGPSARPGGMR